MESEFSPYSLSDKQNSFADSDLLEQRLGFDISECKAKLPSLWAPENSFYLLMLWFFFSWRLLDRNVKRKERFQQTEECGHGSLIYSLASVASPSAPTLHYQSLQRFLFSLILKSPKFSLVSGTNDNFEPITTSKCITLYSDTGDLAWSPVGKQLGDRIFVSSAASDLAALPGNHTEILKLSTEALLSGAISLCFIHYNLSPKSWSTALHVDFHSAPPTKGILDAACTDSKPLPNFHLIESFGPLDSGIHSQRQQHLGFPFPDGSLSSLLPANMDNGSGEFRTLSHWVYRPSHLCSPLRHHWPVSRTIQKPSQCSVYLVPQECTLQQKGSVQYCSSGLPLAPREENSKFSLEGKAARAIQLQREEMRFSDHFSQDADVQCFTPGHSEVFKADILPQFATYLDPDFSIFSKTVLKRSPGNPVLSAAASRLQRKAVKFILHLSKSS
ncbi:hypothetical protein MJT46_011300 [Ovis ammon polii x Ovis aries]|nr:hypothetical protein MJT46_011300 [Ovis ammon polii x Ovis aries]